MARAVHPFPARMAPEVALALVGESEQVLRVLDPMCGSGTVLGLGVSHGHTVTGFDVDPLAVLMASVATQDVDLQRMARLAEECVRTARASTATDADWFDEETREFSRYWFGEEQRMQLVRLAPAINAVEQGPERDALQVALSRIIVTKSPRASLAADTAHSRPHRVITASDYDVYAGFEDSVRVVGRVLGARNLAGSATVRRGDARDQSLFAPTGFDLVVTSPPYLNAIDYLRGHRLALIWFGYSVKELRSIRSSSIGAEAARKGPATEDHEALSRAVIEDLDDLAAATVRLVDRFSHDMLELAGNIERCLVEGGQSIFVVADSVLRGRHIPTGKIVESAVAAKGLEVTDVKVREIPATLRYLPVAGTHLSKRMKHEYVITASKGA